MLHCWRSVFEHWSLLQAQLPVASLLCWEKNQCDNSDTNSIHNKNINENVNVIIASSLSTINKNMLYTMAVMNHTNTNQTKLELITRNVNHTTVHPGGARGVFEKSKLPQI